ncbi:T9SS type A sorting domain-containing protein [Chryseobacterium sp. BIGb0232]|uniref:T9SS type A sorting domain-containing protein n=1 Tax=Chryseobacterium sp. BIGb0232 TaxID=2940598 RepID=UPI000F4916C5|nr:T9SS type A sorting domain-containing protein [Chryseobacterium sp. BIGb0232]MCS4305077.1 putative delta-60 repeat protein [Chryseobacterium sp. BIGb0232]ROS08107.1 putative delta-60 repeat protein/predicted secreted protein (Por secretion system target) [Chryseobacterium nakagawai]
MKKNLLLATLIVQSLSAQIISKDQAFATSGIYSMVENTVWSAMVQNSDSSIFFTYAKENTTSGLRDSFLSKLTVNGTVDYSFGTNGTLQLPYYAYNSQLKKQSDGKLLVMGFSNTGAAVTRLLPNGTSDITFGNNGTVIIPELYPDGNDRSYGIVFQNDKIIVHGVDSPDGLNFKHRIYRLNNNGTIDTTFGANGSVFTQGGWSPGSFVLLDNQNNITAVTNNGIMEKFNSNGNPNTSFGNNGVLQMASGLGFAGTVMMDSNNRIVYSTLNDEVFRINPDGTSDPTFNYNLPDHSGINGGAWILNITEKDGYYYIGGNGEGDFAHTAFISRLTQNGNIDPSFNYYSESDSNLGGIGDMIVNNNNIITIGGLHVVKYIVNNTTLATKEITKSNNNIAFENHVSQNLIYITKDKVAKIEIFSALGERMRTTKESHTPVSDLPKGIYVAKVTFEDGSISTKKIIKN